jgi:hypothetical protein
VVRLGRPRCDAGRPIAREAARQRFSWRCLRSLARHRTVELFRRKGGFRAALSVSRDGPSQNASLADGGKGRVNWAKVSFGRLGSTRPRASLRQGGGLNIRPWSAQDAQYVFGQQRQRCSRLPLGVRSRSSPVRISTMSLASWFVSRGRTGRHSAQPHHAKKCLGARRASSLQSMARLRRPGS